MASSLTDEEIMRAMKEQVTSAKWDCDVAQGKLDQAVAVHRAMEQLMYKFEREIAKRQPEKNT